MLTRKGYMDLLTRVFDTGGLTESMEGDLKKLKDDFDEREGMLRKFGEVYDGEDKEEYEFKEKAHDDYKKKYDDLADRYKRRFFSRDENLNDTAVIESNEKSEKPEKFETKAENLEDLIYKKEEK